MVLLGIAFVWRWSSLRVPGRMLDVALANPDPQVRRAALESIGERWLGPHATVLVDLARRETDPEVIAALTTLVGRHQWEPADNPALVELRMLVLQWLDDAETGEPSLTAAQIEFEPAALLTWLSAVLGEPVRELRIHQAHGSAVARRPQLPSTERAGCSDGQVP